MFKNIDLFTKRYLQITMVFMLFSFIQQFFHIPHDSWIIITSAMIYSGFNPGTVLKRAYMRFSGTILGVAAITIAWYFMHFDYRLAFIFLVLICWAIVFFMGLPYNRYMIVVTLFSDILIQWDNSNKFNIQFYVVDRIVCTAIVFAICLVIEYLWFGKSNMTTLNFINLRDSLKDDMRSLYKITQERNLSSGNIFKGIKKVNLKIDRLELLISDAKYEQVFHEFTEDEKKFGRDIVLLFRRIVSVHYLQMHDPLNPEIISLKEKVALDVAKL